MMIFCKGCFVDFSCCVRVFKKMDRRGGKTVVAFVVDDLPAASVGFGTNYNLFI